jgi:hypothetical protein
MTFEIRLRYRSIAAGEQEPAVVAAADPADHVATVGRHYGGGAVQSRTDEGSGKVRSHEQSAAVERLVILGPAI